MTVVNFTNVYFFPNRRPPISQIEHGSKNGPPNTYFISKKVGFWLGAGGIPGKARRRPQTGGTPNQGPQVSPNERGSKKGLPDKYVVQVYSHFTNLGWHSYS